LLGISKCAATVFSGSYWWAANRVAGNKEGGEEGWFRRLVGHRNKNTRIAWALLALRRDYETGPADSIRDRAAAPIKSGSMAAIISVLQSPIEHLANWGRPSMPCASTTFGEGSPLTVIASNATPASLKP